MSWVENGAVVAHKTLVCFAAGSSWCALLKCFGCGGRAWPLPISGHVVLDMGWLSTPSPHPGCSAGSASDQPQLQPHCGGCRVVGHSGHPPSSWRCPAPAVQLSARGRFWHDTHRYCLYMFLRADVPIGYLSLPRHRHFAACALGISTVMPWL